METIAHGLMKTFNNLKTRLEALPSIREGRNHVELYAQFLEDSKTASENLLKSQRGASFADGILPAPGYGGVFRMIRTASGIALRLRRKLAESPGAIVEKNTEESFNRLFENASSSLQTCQTTWGNQLQAKIRDWQAIAEVVSKLADGENAKAMKVQARKLKTSIDSLVESKKNLPQLEQEAFKAQNDLKELSDSVSQLGLNTPFGKFLQEAASPRGADLSASQDEAISKQISDLKLDKVFRVRLSS